MPDLLLAPKTATKTKLYGMWWAKTQHPLSIELTCIYKGGKWVSKGHECGNGLYFHMRRAQELLWPDKRWHHWRELSLQLWLENQYIGEMGCSSAGKSDDAATNHLADWYAFSSCTTVLVCSTTLPAGDLRAWGNIKRYHKEAKRRFEWLPGHLIEGARKILNDAKDQFTEGREFKNGLVAIAAKKGNTYVGIADWIGIHNKRVRVLADEANMLPKSFLDACSNLSKCEDFKATALGNPNDSTNAHGVMCEPAVELGGWDSNIDQQPGTKHWKTKMPRGVCIQKPASDSPNFRAPEDEPPPFPFLITRAQVAEDAAHFGTDDWHYQMFVEARLPRGLGSHRVLTRQMCERFGALKEPIWRDTARKSIAFMDAAYGGDRCVFGELQFGHEARPSDDPVRPLLRMVGSERDEGPNSRTIIALIDLVVVPISAAADAEIPEEQIVNFVMNECTKRNIPAENFYFEAGMRTALLSSFARIWSPAVNSVDSGSRPSETPVSADISTSCKDYYSKFITELWYSVRLCVEARQFRGMTQEAMWEFCAREWKTVAGGKIELETKKEMKLKCGRSPDLADAVSIGIFGARQKGFVISKMSDLNPNQRQNNRWKQDLRQQARDIWKSKDLTYK